MVAREVGVRELKIRASEIVRDVRQHRIPYTVTHRGRAVALIVPLAEAPARRDDQDRVWDELEQLGREIGAGWQSSLTSTELLSEMRR